MSTTISDNAMEETMKRPMRLVGLDGIDRTELGAIDTTGILLDQLGTILKDVPPDRWGDAAKKLPEGFVASICKQGTVDRVNDIIGTYGIPVGVGAVAGVATYMMSKEPVIALVAAGLSGYLTYLLTHKDNATA